MAVADADGPAASGVRHRRPLPELLMEVRPGVGARLTCGKCGGRCFTEPDLIEDKRVDIVCVRCGARWYATRVGRR